MAVSGLVARQQIALYTADMLPPGDAIGVPVKLVRKEALARAPTVTNISVIAFPSFSIYPRVAASASRKAYLNQSTT